MISLLSNVMGFTKPGRDSDHEAPFIFFSLENCVCPFCCSLGRQLGGLMHEENMQTEKCKNLFPKRGSTLLSSTEC